MSLVEIYKYLSMASFALAALLLLICILLLTKGGAYKTIKEFLYKKNLLKIDIQDDNYIPENAVLEDEEGGLLKIRDLSEATALMNQEKEKSSDQDYSHEQDETLPLYEESEEEETLPLEEMEQNNEDAEQTAMLYDDGTDETLPLSLNITSTSKTKKEQEENSQKKIETSYANGTMILEHEVFCESKEI